MRIGLRHRVATAAKTSPRLTSLLTDVIPDYSVAVAIAERARQLIIETQNSSREQTTTYPATADAITPKWIEGEITRRRATSDTQLRIALLDELEVNALQESHELIEAHAVELVAALGKQLAALVERLTAAVAVLDDEGGVATAAEAITAGTAATAAWQQIADATTDYADIRRTQHILYSGCSTISYDELRSGDGNPNITDPEARLHHHKHLDRIAPDWRGVIDTNKAVHPAKMPWPDDNTERLVWCIRHDTGIWCPTPAEIRQHLDSQSAATALTAGPAQLVTR